jgi:hypothetical protein
MRGLILVLTFGLIFYGFLRLGHARQRNEPGSPLLTKALAQSAPAAGLVEQRHQAMLQEGNLWEAARALARQVFEPALGHPSGPVAGAPANAIMTPRVEAPGGWWQRWRVGREVRKLWELAYGPVPVRVSPRQFRRLKARLDTIQSALAQGTVRLFLPENAT